MKAILSYGLYLNQGKQYQIKFIYENEEEINTVKNFLKQYNNNKSITVVKETHNTDTISKTNIPKELLLQFIGELLITYNIKLIIGKQEFTSFDLINIKEAIDSLHINVVLRKGKYFNFRDCYYVTFKYATKEQKEEVIYDFNVNLKPIMSPQTSYEKEYYLFPFIVDNNGKITTRNSSTIGGTNIPEKTLPFFISRFIKGYNAVVTIGNEKFKDNIDSTRISTAITSLNPEQVKVRRKYNQKKVFKY